MTSPLHELGQPGLPQIFTPAAAAEILRAHGLPVTECALKARAYRKQVPFHLNGRRIVFTTADLAEIAEGQAHKPEPGLVPIPRTPSPKPTHRRPARRCPEPTETWRARRPHDLSPEPKGTPR